MASTLFLGCAPGVPVWTYNYAPPEITSDPGNYTVVINKPFDQAWISLVDYVSATFFSVRNFEKASGLITLSFGAADPKKFVDCGRWTTFRDGQVQKQESYLDGREENTTFSGSTNLFMRKLDANRTQLRINTRYRLRIKFRNSRPETWVFRSGETATIKITKPSRGTIPTRTCGPTYVAEREVLKWVKSN